MTTTTAEAAKASEPENALESVAQSILRDHAAVEQIEREGSSPDQMREIHAIVGGSRRQVARLATMPAITAGEKAAKASVILLWSEDDLARSLAADLLRGAVA